VKKLIGIVCAVSLVTGLMAADASAAKMYAGVKGGVNLANLSGSDVSNTSMHAGFMGGGFLGVDFTDQFGARLEALYVMKGAKVDTASVSGTVKVNYVEIPVLFVANLVSKDTGAFNIFAGPTFAFNASAKAEAGGLSADIKDSIKSFEFGATVGVGGEYKLSSVSIIGDVRYSMGATSIAKDQGSQTFDVKTRGIGIMAGVKIPFGGK
jgi:Outer membrane protein beta-barrel domain